MDILVSRLTKANEAYRNGNPLLMTDDEYDQSMEELSRKVPNHPLLKKLRATPSAKHTVQMPFYLGSLDKAKTKEELDKWAKKQLSPYIVSEKLDGISGLWNPSSKLLYLSGDDNTGLDVSAWLPYISLSPKTASDQIPKNVWIRGELIMPRKYIPEGKLGRSITNGLFHLKTPNPTETAKVRFVAYETLGISPDPAVQDQMKLLEGWSLWVPWLALVSDLSSTQLTSFLEKRRLESDYDMDGLVIKTNLQSPVRIVKGNPKDAIAWKPPNGESKITKVIQVEWNASANGKLIPRVQIEPVHLGGSTINFVTGVNARRITDWKIGPGASVILRKGGDVIPLIESVEVSATVIYPQEGTWKWDGPPETAIHIVQTTADSSTNVSQFMKMAKHLDWPSIGPAVMKAVVDAGYTTVPLLRSASEDTLKKLLGPVKGSNLFKIIQTDGWSKASEIDLFIASPLRPDGIGSSRLIALQASEPDYTKWPHVTVVPKGWSQDSLKEFQKIWSLYETFRKEEWSFLPYPVKVTVQTVLEYKGSIVFTGFRDQNLETQLTAKGYKVSDLIRQDTKAILIPDTEDPQTYTSTKIDKAKRIPGCSILRKSSWNML